MKILIKDIDVVTADVDNMILERTNIAIEDSTIIKITSDKNLLKDFTPDKTIEGSKMLAMPGLVNAHTHTPMTILRNYADDLVLEDWLFNYIFPAEAKLTQKDVYWGSLLGIAEMISGGTTAFADMYYHCDQTAWAVKASGIRANLSFSAYSFEFENGTPKFFDKRKEYADFQKNWNNAADGRMKTYVLVHSPYIYDANAMKDSADFAKEMNTGIHIHILETAKELADTREKYGEDGAMAALHAGIFDVPCIAAHCVHLTDENIAVFKEKGVHVVHNPTSNLKLGSGIARIGDIQKQGVNIALGTDGAASNNNLNMFEEIHLAALIHKGVAQDPTQVSAQDAVLMATTRGAKALGFGDTVGMVKEGMKADLILIDMDKIHLTPNNHPISSLAYAVQASDVDTVIINGEVVMEKRQIKTIDIEQAKYEVTGIIKRIKG